MGVLKSGCTLFLVSTRNTAAAVADMLKRTNTTQILISQDATIRGIAADALSQLSGSQVTVRDMPVFEDLYSDATTNSAFTDVNVKLPETHNPDALAIILHSSGKIFRVAGDL